MGTILVNILLLDANFDKLIIGSSKLAKFLEHQRLNLNFL